MDNFNGEDYGIEAVEEKETSISTTDKSEQPFTLTEDGEVILRSGKRIKLRKKTGAHHMVENRLVAACVPRGSKQDDMGINIGDMVALSDIKAVVSIQAINGKEIKMPRDLAGVFEVMSEFSYDHDIDEWSDFKLAVTPNKEKVEELAKNLQRNNGSVIESALPTEVEPE